MADPYPNDDAVLSAARAGDAHALERLQRRHLPALWDFAVRCTLDEYAARLVVREVFERSGARLASAPPHESFATVIYSLAVRQLAYREPVDPSLAADQPRYHAWPDAVPPGIAVDAVPPGIAVDAVPPGIAVDAVPPGDEVDPAIRHWVWMSARKAGAEYKALDLHVRRGLPTDEVNRVLGGTPDTAADLAATIAAWLQALDSALGPVGDAGYSATQIFRLLVSVAPDDALIADLWRELRGERIPNPRRVRQALTAAGIAAAAVFATVGSLRAFGGDDPPTRVLDQQVVRSTTTRGFGVPSTQPAPTLPGATTTTVAGAPGNDLGTTPGSTAPTTTRRSILGGFLPSVPDLPTTTTAPGPTPSSSSTTTRPGGGTSSSTTTRPGSTTTTPGVTTTTAPPTTTSTTTTTTPPPTSTTTTTTAPPPTSTTTTTTAPPPTSTTTTTTTTTTPPVVTPPVIDPPAPG